VPLLGALGAATGAIAIGMAEMSTSTTIIISIATIISTATSVAKAATGSTIRNTEEMRPTGTGKPRINSAVRVLLIALVVELERDPAVGLELGIVLVEELALAIVQVAAELEHVQVPAELEHDQVVVEREHDLVAAELELAQVEVELVPVPGQPHAQLAVLLKTKLVTATHHRDLVRLLAAEDLAAAAAETTRVPAATEEVVAWAAADIAVAVAEEEDAAAGE
jgi:hypothetical protein